MISAMDLESIALREVRSYPGGEFVANVEVIPSGEDWSIAVTARDGADMDRIQFAVERTANRLKHRYTLRTDW
nr:hypothetical protein [Bradyrhizobium tropiciagri]